MKKMILDFYLPFQVGVINLFSITFEMTIDQGCNHDRAADNACLSAGYNFGYKNPIQRFTDIMSYDCPDCHCQYNCGTDWCPTTAARISNTNFLYNSHPIGYKKNNCA